MAALIITYCFTFPCNYWIFYPFFFLGSKHRCNIACMYEGGLKEKRQPAQSLPPFLCIHKPGPVGTRAVSHPVTTSLPVCTCSRDVTVCLKMGCLCQHRRDFFFRTIPQSGCFLSWSPQYPQCFLLLLPCFCICCLRTKLCLMNVIAVCSPHICGS